MMPGTAAYGGAPAAEVPPSQGPVFAAPSGAGNMIPSNVAGIVLLSAGALIALKMLRFNFVIGVG